MEPYGYDLCVVELVHTNFHLSKCPIKVYDVNVHAVVKYQ
jgi:hypothetical protein